MVSNYLDENNIDVSESVALEHGHEVVLLYDEVQQVDGGLLVGPLDAPRLLYELLEAELFNSSSIVATQFLCPLLERKTLLSVHLVMSRVRTTCQNFLPLNSSGWNMPFW